MSDLLRVIALTGLVAANAFFVIGEYAVVTARRSVLARRAELGSAAARAALRLMDDPVRVISTVQVGITAIGVLTGAIGQPLVADLLGDAIPGWVSFVLAFAVVTYVSVVFGELVPKALTLDRAETLAALVSRPIAVLARAFRPIVWLLQRSGEIVLRPFGVTEVVAGDTIRSSEELRDVIDEAEGSGVIARAQEEMLHNVFDFARREAADVMVHAAEVAWLDANASPEAALERALEHTHQRYPVGDGTLDRYVGVVHFHELVRAARTGDARTIASLARPAPVVPGTKDLGALLRDLREARQPLAVVADEYGGSVGIVTLEDIVEEIVGDIEDEYDLPDDEVSWVDDNTVLVAGTMTIDDFNDELGTHLPHEGGRTMAGLIFATLGRRPVPGDEASVGGVSLAVEEVDGLRITRLRVGPVAQQPRT